MLENKWFKKQSPLRGLTGLWGGIADNLTGAAFVADPGQTVFTSGSHSWTVPAGVSNVSAVFVGGGGSGAGTYSGRDGGGGGGGAEPVANDSGNGGSGIVIIRYKFQ